MINRLPSHVVLLASASMLAVACGDSHGPVSPPLSSSSSPGQPAQIGALRPLDDDLGRVAGMVPAFGGLFVDGTGTLTVYLTDLRQRAAAAAALATVLGERRDFVVRQASFGFSELSAWHAKFAEILGLGGVVLTDIDERQNRLSVGISDESVRPQIEAKLTTLGIPRDAVVIYHQSPISYAVTLRDFSRPPIGGLQIAFSGFLCTLGFNGDGGGQVFVTASHCTDVQGGVENTTYYQPTVAPGNEIGTEIRDPAYFQNSAGCPVGRRCRYSDAALIQYSIANPWRYLGMIANTTSKDPRSGSITLVNDPNFPFGQRDIGGVWGYTEPAPLAGAEADKVGRTTGWTYGPIVNTCADINVSNSDVTLFCQYLVNAGADEGDSGSPVFFPYDAGTPFSVLYGVLWGGSGGTQFAFSPMPSVIRELEAQNVYWCYC